MSQILVGFITGLFSCNLFFSNARLLSEQVPLELFTTDMTVNFMQLTLCLGPASWADSPLYYLVRKTSSVLLTEEF